MKSKLILINICLLFITNVFSQSVSSEEAKTAALKYFQLTQSNFDSKVKNIFGNKYLNITSKYIVVMENLDWIIISADKKADPILAFSDEQNYSNNHSPAFEWWVSQYDKYVYDIVQKRMEPDLNIKNRWDVLLGNEPYNNTVKETKGVPILLTSKWGQTESNDENGEASYNLFAPFNEDCETEHCPAGCVAVAMGQIMNYWDYPECPNLEWGLMPDILISTNANYVEQRNAIAFLLRQIGDAVNMDYCSDGCSSSGSLENALLGFQTFNYTTAEIEAKSNYSNGDWKDLLKNELDKLRPIFYTGFSSSGGGHAFVVDGWKYNFWGDMFHFNWGWNGTDNNFYKITEQNYQTNQRVILNLYRNFNCNSTWTVLQSYKNDPVFSSLYYYNPVAGSILTSDGVQIEAFDVVNYQAYQNVILSPGFSSLNGSHFIAEVIDCPINCDFLTGKNYSTMNNNYTTDNNKKSDVLDLKYKEEIKIYPNPTSDILNIVFSDYSDGLDVQIIDLYGRILLHRLLKKNTSNIDLSLLKPGLYYIRFNAGGDKIITKKIIKE